MIRPLRQDDDLTPLVTAWAAEWDGARFGLSIDQEKVIADLKQTARGPESIVFAKIDDNQVVGILGLETFVNPYGRERIANEKKWYVMPKYRGQVRDFWIYAKGWAVVHGCTHIMLNASYMASDRCERVGALYEKMMGLAPFERAYIGRV
jgi:hypothetical protein